MTKSLSQLPHPRRSLVWGNTAEFAKDPLRFLVHCSQDYEEIVPLRFGLAKGYFLNQPQHIEQVLKEREIFIKNTPAWRALRTLVGDGLLTSEGDFWARQRRLTQPVFHQQRIADYGETMVRYAEQMMQSWQAGEVRDIHADMTHLTLNIVTKTLFNMDTTGAEAQTIAHTLDITMEWFASKRKQGFLLLSWLPTEINRRYQQALQEMDQSIYAMIQQRRQSESDPGDLLSMLMAVRDEVDGSQMTDRQLRDELTTLVTAGHETTANALSWTWMLLAQHPEAQTRLTQELDTVLAGRSPTVADLPHLPYSHQVIKESMRLYPPVFSLARYSTQSYNLDGYEIPANSIVMFSPWAMHRHPRYFTEPEAFQPERWITDMEKQLPKGVYFPFGDGPRICIGRSFALMEAVLLLATIAQQFQFTLVPEHPIVPLPSITLRPQDGILVKVEKRGRGR
jgi:cytochrome P450